MIIVRLSCKILAVVSSMLWKILVRLNYNLGQFRAEVACANLLLMNPDVKGDAYVKSPKEFIEG